MFLADAFEKPGVFQNSAKAAFKARKVATRLASLTGDAFLCHPYVLEWPDDKPMTWVYQIKADITLMHTDAIVNAANNTLLVGGGVDGAIHKAAGPQLLEECQAIRNTRYPQGLPTGEAVMTKGYNLHSKYVIHTAGPVWEDGKHGEPELLFNCYFNSLVLAKKNKLETIAFPEISTGSYGYPKEEARLVVVKAIKAFVEKFPGAIDDIYLVRFE